MASKKLQKKTYTILGKGQVCYTILLIAIIVTHTFSIIVATFYIFAQKFTVNYQFLLIFSSVMYAKSYFYASLFEILFISSTNLVRSFKIQNYQNYLVLWLFTKLYKVSFFSFLSITITI